MSKITNNTTIIKQINTELIKSTLKLLKHATKPLLANETGLSLATCNTILNELLITGEVIAVELEASNGGRPATRFMYNADFSYIACIYTKTEGGVNTIAYVITNLIGEIIKADSIIVKIINYEIIESVIGNLIDEFNNIKAVGIGMQGVVTNGVIGVCDIKELIDVPLAANIKAKYNLEVIIDNDMNFTVYGFYKKQNYDTDKSNAILFFPKDNFPGSGMIVDGHILRGNTNFAGEISFLPFDLSREELLSQINNKEKFIPLVVKSIISIIAVINPEVVVLTGDLFEEQQLKLIYNRCLKIIPEEHMPKIILKNNIHEEYIAGIISITLETLTSSIKLVNKRF